MRVASREIGEASPLKDDASNEHGWYANPVVSSGASSPPQGGPFAPSEVVREIGARPQRAFVVRGAGAKDALAVGERYEGVARAGNAAGEMFVREARRIATLASPHLPRVREVTVRQDDLIVLSELVEGEKLAGAMGSRQAAARDRAAHRHRRARRGKCAPQPARHQAAADEARPRRDLPGHGRPRSRRRGARAPRGRPSRAGRQGGAGVVRAPRARGALRSGVRCAGRRLQRGRHAVGGSDGPPALRVLPSVRVRVRVR